MDIYIMMGIAGSGKSTFASKAVPAAVVCSADHYHMLGGVYMYDPAKAREAHALCLKKYIGLISMGPEIREVVVDNTNVHMTQVAPYVALAIAYGHAVKVMVFHRDIETCSARNIHGVPLETLRKMYMDLGKTMADWPAFWPQLEHVTEG